MIKVTITLEELTKHGACSDGLDLFLAIAGKSDRVEIEWSPLCDVWLAVGARHFVQWLIVRKIIPRANLYGADLYGADLGGADLRGARRWTDDVAVPGWELVNGVLRKAAS